MVKQAEVRTSVAGSSLDGSAHRRRRWWLGGMVLSALLAGGLAMNGSGLANAQEQEAPSTDATEWRKIDPAAIPDNPVALFGKDWMALAAGREGDFNAMTIGWGGLGTLWGMDNAVVTVYVAPTRYTHEYMEKNEYFTVTAFPEAHRDALKVLGSRSGRDGDKIAAAGLTVSFTELGNPIFNEGRLVLECRKIYRAPFDPAGMGERGKAVYAPGRNLKPHTIYMGEVVNAWVK